MDNLKQMLFQYHMYGLSTIQFVVIEDKPEIGIGYLEKMTKEHIRSYHSNMVGKGGKDMFPFKPGNHRDENAKFYYTPWMNKQALYDRVAREGRISVGPDIELIDSFICLGGKFNLANIQCSVEVKSSSMGGGIVWAEIYHVADSQVPSAIIRVEESPIFK